MSSPTSPTLPLAEASQRLRRRPGRPRPRLSTTADAHSSPPRVRRNVEDQQDRTDGAEVSITSGPSNHIALMTISETASYLRCSRWLVRQMIQGGYLSPIRLPLPVSTSRRSGAMRRVLVDRAEVNTLIKQGRAA